MTNATLLAGSMSEIDALTCDDPITSLMARLSVSNVQDSMTAFVQSEMDRPGATPDHLLIGIAAWMMQIHASLAAYYFVPEAADEVMKQFQQVFDKTYREHFVDSATLLTGAA